MTCPAMLQRPFSCPMGQMEVTSWETVMRDQAALPCPSGQHPHLWIREIHQSFGDSSWQSNATLNAILFFVNSFLRETFLLFVIWRRAKDSVKHFQVTRNNNGYVFGFNEFPSLQDFVNHFANLPLLGSDTGTQNLISSFQHVHGAHIKITRMKHRSTP